MTDLSHYKLSLKEEKYIINVGLNDRFKSLKNFY